MSLRLVRGRWEGINQSLPRYGAWHADVPKICHWCNLVRHECVCRFAACVSPEWIARSPQHLRLRRQQAQGGAVHVNTIQAPSSSAHTSPRQQCPYKPQAAVPSQQPWGAQARAAAAGGGAAAGAGAAAAARAAAGLPAAGLPAAAGARGALRRRLWRQRRPAPAAATAAATAAGATATARLRRRAGRLRRAAGARPTCHCA